MTQDDIFVVGATRVAVGLSTIVKLSPGEYQHSYTIKILAGSGTLELVRGSSAGGVGWGTGYPLGTSEVLNLGGPATYYLAASAATMTVAVLIGQTAGATVV